ncbi:hypothetical protein JDV02_005434 [Purpureocillium takamizusanense]|uniref:Ribosomal protein S11 n=1 Tax=Purpureocillium takamizusanense TaxID=2060973 RepID=A0A9Q8QIG9_9HYPO|nr:uncharacterized protein JDV02_005434 [Purpureocillium takamizusanense]UNI19237.1 hypothetical protein JDV02_005434 [Purpureocillium takamizusanense]
MSRPLTTRLAAQTRSLRLRPSQPLAPQCVALRNAQSFSHSSTRWDEPKGNQPKQRMPARPRTESLLENIYGASRSTQQKPNAMADLSQSMVFKALNKSNIDTSALSRKTTEAVQPRQDELEPYHFHIYSHKHNTHITCTKPNREPIISMSCGNIGFKGSRRSTFDAAYSLTKYVLERLIHTGWPMKMKHIELVLRGFGQGREAAVKVLMSPEGRVFREKIIRVADSTRIKFGGTRSEKRRRL